MILGIGVDIIEISRLAKVEQRFIERVYTPEEIAGLGQSAGRRAEQLAGMFSAKEAVVKALGCGFGRIRPQEVEICSGGGPPSVRLTGNAKALADELGIHTMHISISHCKEYATAYAVAESIPK